MARRKVLKETPGSKLFGSLTCREIEVIQAKLTSGVTTSFVVAQDYGFHEEVHDVMHDLHVAWNKRWNAEHPDSAFAVVR